jgi:hypothetical protein
LSVFKLFFAYVFLGSAVLYGALFLFDVRSKFWEPVLPMLAGFLCSWLLPAAISGLVGFVAMILILRFTTRAEWAAVVYPILITRVALTPALMTMGLSWKT